jgi:hypothetical protein
VSQFNTLFDGCHSRVPFPAAGGVSEPKSLGDSFGSLSLNKPNNIAPTPELLIGCSEIVMAARFHIAR